MTVTAAASGMALSPPAGAVISDVVITDESLIAIRPFPILAGTWLSSDPQVATRIVLNSTAAANVDIVPGQWLLHGPNHSQRSSVISGVVQDGEDRPIAYLSFADAEQWGWDSSTSETFAIMVTGSAASTSALRALDASYNSLDYKTGVQSIARTDTMVRTADEVETTRNVFGVVITLSLLGTVIGISNVGFASVKERAHELSLRRALGSTRTKAFAVILLESQIVAVGSWLLAMGISVACYPQVAVAFGVPAGVDLPAYPLSAAGFGLLLGSGSALLGALAPALRAARSNLSTVMRA